MKWMDIEQTLDRNLIYYVWTVRRYQSQDIFFLVTQTKLLTLKFTDEGWTYSLIHGYQGRSDDDDQDSRLKPTIRFGIYPLYFIRESPRGRGGWIRPYYKIYSDETAEPADVSWNPEELSSIEDYTGQTEAYQDLLDALGEGDYTVQPAAQPLRVPEFYLSRPMAKAAQNLHLRNTQEARALIFNSPDYDSSKTLKQNQQDLLLSFGEDAGLRRIAFPWKYFCGQGVPVSHPGIMGEWFARPFEKLLFEDVGLKVNLGPQYLK